MRKEDNKIFSRKVLCNRKMTFLVDKLKNIDTHKICHSKQ